MTSVQASNSAAYDQWGIDKKQPDEKDNELGRNEFMELMIAQMNNQNPLKPQENGDFIAQLAQFSTLEGIEDMSGSMDTMATSYKSSQALTASGLVGGAVTVDNVDESQLRWGDLVYGSSVIPPGMDGLELTITNEAGQVVEKLPLGYQPVGDLTFKWDGVNVEVNGELLDIDYDKFQKDADGNLIPHSSGMYQFSITGSNFEGKNEMLDMAMSARVESVTIDEDNSIRLNLTGGGTTTLDKVHQINHVV